MNSKNNGYIEVGNIFPRREFNYVSDVCEGFLSSIKLKHKGQIINIGNGYDVSIKELVQILARLMNKKIKLKISKKRIRPSKSEVMQLRASFKKAKKLLNWQPVYKNLNGLEKGLRETINWNLKNKNNFYKKYTV